MAKKQSKKSSAKTSAGKSAGAKKQSVTADVAAHKEPKHIIAELTGGPTQPAVVRVADDPKPDSAPMHEGADAVEAKPPRDPKKDEPSKPPRPSAEKPGVVVRIVRAAGRFALRTSVPEILLLISLILSRWLQNSDFSYPQEVFVPIVLFAVLATIIFYVYKLILRRDLAAHAAALPLVYGLYGYTYTFPWLHHFADKFIKQSIDTPLTHGLIFMGVVAVVFGVAAFVLDFVMRHVKQLRSVPLLKIAVFVVVFVFAGQVYKTATRLWTIRHQLAYQQPASLTPAKPAQATVAAKPNVYYLLFDRYANANTLSKDYNYNNGDLLNFLSDQGFVTRDQAYSNYPFTMQSVSSTLAMSYFPNLNKSFTNDGGDWQSAFPYRATLNNPPAAQALKQNGYTYNQVASWWDFTRDGIQADNQPTKAFRLRTLGMTFWMTDLQRDIINKSILSPLLKKGLTFGKHIAVLYDLDTAPRDNFEQQMAALKTIAGNSKMQKTPQFTFAHVLVPHDPYIFGPDGSDPTYSGDRDDNGADEVDKYTNQLTYLNTRLKDLIANIRTNDPGAAIILQADEGPYPKQFRGTLTPGHYYNPINLPLEQMQQKFGVLASYYLPNVDAETVAAQMTSPVNAFRVVLNTYLGYSLDLLPDCQFATGDKYQLYGYALVSGKLRGTAEPAACQQYQ